jgi:hypothetical protein
MSFAARVSLTVVRACAPHGARLPSNSPATCPGARRVSAHSLHSSCRVTPTQRICHDGSQPIRAISFAHRTLRNASKQSRAVTYAQKAKDLNQKGIDAQMSEYDTGVPDETEKQTRAPWHREGADVPPVERRQRSASKMTKGKLLTTPSRLLKLVLPLTTLNQSSDRTDIAPLALLVHPQQPLSYLERLIQSELPTITNEKGENRVPAVSFKAMEAKDDEIKPSKKKTDKELEEEEESVNEQRGKHVDSYGGAGREGTGKDDGDFVRWSASTEIGDFIRDAARAKEFEVEIEGAEDSIKIGVPSFNDRTFYLRQRLRKTARKLSDMAKVKEECDQAAHRGGQRIAMGGCGILVAYWYIVRPSFLGTQGTATLVQLSLTKMACRSIGLHSRPTSAGTPWSLSHTS